MRKNLNRNRRMRRMTAILMLFALLAASPAMHAAAAPATEETEEAAQERALTAEELDELNDSLNPDENGFFASVYSRPEEIDWTQVFYSGAGIEAEMTDEQVSEYENRNGPAVAGLFAVRKEDVERFVKEKTGTDYAEALNGLYGNWDEIDDLYVLQHGDTNYRPVEFFEGTVSEDNIYHLHYIGSDPGSYLPEEEMILTARIEDGEWTYISNLKANVPAPQPLLTIDFYEDEESAPELSPAYEIEIEQKPSDEPFDWYYAVITAQTDAVKVELTRTEDDSTLEEILMQEGYYRPDESLADFTLDEGECAVVNVNMPWHPVIRISASCGSYYGEYLFGSDNWKHLEDENGIPLQRTVTGHDNSAEDRGPYYRNETGLAGFLEGNWLYEDESTGEVLAAMRIRDFRMADIYIFEDNAEIAFDYGHLLTPETGAPDLISVSAYDDHTLEKLPAGFGPGDSLGDYLIAAHQEDGFQILEMLQVNNGYGALGTLLGTDEDEVLFSFYRYEGAYSWKEAYKNLLADCRIETVFAEDEEDYSNLFYRWFLYDIDKNGIPELIIEHGSCEADYNAELFTFRNGSVRSIRTDSGEDRIGMGHTALWTVPEKNGILHCWGHMGSSQICEWTLKGTTLVQGEVLAEEYLMDMPDGSDLTRPDELVENAIPLSSFEPAETLPIDWYERWADVYAQDEEPEETEWAQEPAFYSELKQNGDAEVLVCPMDKYMNPGGRMAYADLFREGVLYEYTSGDLKISSEHFADMNGDGRTDVILYLKEQGSQDPMYRVILAWQDNEVYAYSSFGAYDENLLADGTIRYEETYLQCGMRVLFRRDQSFAYYIP